MPFDDILRRLFLQKDVESVIFLDSEGEEIFSYGGEIDHDRLKLMGAYQGIVLSCIKRLELGNNGTVITRCGSGSILTHQLKDGYFVCVLLNPDANVAYAHFQFRDYFLSLEKEL
jgi:hypothetical protein